MAPFSTDDSRTQYHLGLRRRRGHLLLVFWLVTLGACASHSMRQRSLPRGELDPARTRISGYLEQVSTFGKVDERQLVPGAISKAAVTDELVVTRRSETDVCVQMTMRTPTAMDEPLTTWEVVLNGEDTFVDHESVAGVVDYDYAGSHEVISLESFVKTKSTEAGLNLSISEPNARVFRVVERVAEVCGPSTLDGAIRLSLRIAGANSAGPTKGWQAHYRWVLR